MVAEYILSAQVTLMSSNVALFKEQMLQIYMHMGIWGKEVEDAFIQ